MMQVWNLLEEKWTVNGDDSVEDDWCISMEKSLQKGLNFLLQICHFHKLQEKVYLRSHVS
jgi:hypothetical protein